MLFDLLAVARDEKQQYSAKTNDTTECILLPGSWVSKRKDISDLLNGFDTSSEFIVCGFVSYAIMQVLTKFQKLSGVPDTESRKQDRQDAQFHDDKTLLEEMTTQIKAILFKDARKYVSMCLGLFCYRPCSQNPHLRK